MRFIIWISAVMIAGALNLEYCKEKELGMFFVGVIALCWDVAELLIFKDRK